MSKLAKAALAWFTECFVIDAVAAQNSNKPMAPSEHSMSALPSLPREAPGSAGWQQKFDV
jgi:hypothetical protein